MLFFKPASLWRIFSKLPSFVPKRNFFVARRAICIVQGDDQEKINHLKGLNIDMLVFDMVSVSYTRKATAREIIRSMLEAGKVEGCHPRTEWAVRLNQPQTNLCREDIFALFGGSSYPTTVLLHTVESPDDISWFSQEVLKTRPNLNTFIKLIYIINSATGLVKLNTIIRRSLDILDSETMTPVGIIFESKNFSRTIGAIRAKDNVSNEFLYARQKSIVVGRSYNLHVIDMSYRGNDLNELRTQTENAALMGFSGKLCHAKNYGQYKIIQEIFLPDLSTKNWALGLLIAYKKHLNMGQGALVYDNIVIGPREIKQAIYVMKIFKLGQSEKPGTEDPPPENVIASKTMALSYDFSLDEVDFSKLEKLRHVDKFDVLPNIFKDNVDGSSYF